MIQNMPVKTLVHKDLTIEGYSRAAVQTYWRVPELKIGFDLGAQPWSFMSTATWFVSHAIWTISPRFRSTLRGGG